MNKYPNILRVNAELEKLEAFRKAHPNRQPDTPDEFRED